MAMLLRKFATVLSHIKYEPIQQTGINFFQRHSMKQYSTFHLKNYYSVLGVKPDATDEKIKEAYYSLSKKYHPDLNIGNKNAESKILEINEAFEVLGNKLEKEKYDNRMFPKVWEKESFVYEHEPPTSKPKDFIFRRVNKAMSHTFDQYIRHKKGEENRKQRHAAQKVRFNKSQSTQKLSKTFFKT